MLSYIKRSAIVRVRNIWRHINDRQLVKDFELFHYHLNEDTPTETDLYNDMMVFLDTTSVAYSRALDSFK